MVKPAGRKQAARHLIDQHQISERAACQLAGVSRTGFRYQVRPRDDGALRARLKELAAKQSAYGYLLLHGLLKAEGLVVNRKRTYRIYTEEGLQPPLLENGKAACQPVAAIAAFTFASNKPRIRCRAASSEASNLNTSFGEVLDARHRPQPSA